MSDITRDTFTDTAGTALTAHTGEQGAAWSDHPSNTGSAVITPTGTVRANQSGFSEFYASGVPANANYSVEGVIDLKSVISGQFPAIAARLQTAAHEGYFGYNFNGTWVLQDDQGSIATFVAAAANGDRVRVACNGSNIRLWLNNIRRGNVTNTRITGAGRTGLFFSGNATDTTGAHLTSLLSRPITEVPILIEDGDSQMASTNTSPTLAMAHAMQPAITDTFDSEMVATGGHSIANRISAYATDVAPKFRADAPRNVLALYAGTNDVYFLATGTGGESLTAPENIAAIVISRLQSYAALANATGFDTVVGTITPRSFTGGGGFDPDPYDLNPIIDDINEWLRENWQDHFDRLADLAADSRLDDESDATYYDADEIHWNATGAAVAGQLYAAQINDLAAEPAITAVTAPTDATIGLAGTELTVAWTYQGTITEVDLYRKMNGGAYELIEANVTNTGSYAWTPTADDVSGQVQIEVRSSADPEVAAESASFIIATYNPGVGGAWKNRARQFAIEAGYEVTP